MKYMGSKNRVAKYIVHFIHSAIKTLPNPLYIEPFVGGGNIIDKVDYDYKVGFDNHKYLISLFNKLKDGWNPPLTIDEQEYCKVRDNKDSYPDYYVGFVGFLCSYGGKYFAGFPRGKDNKGNDRDYANEAIRNILKQINNLKNVEFIYSDYREIEVGMGNVVYCDPPYRNTVSYKGTSFDFEQFDNWVRTISQDNIVFISEYDMPNDFSVIWSKKIDSNLSQNGIQFKEEKLFIHNSLLEKYPKLK